MEIILIALIRVYQKTISPDHGFVKVLFPHGYCKFYPSCSEYAVQVLEKDGVWGLPKIFKRLLKCHPGAHPAVDLP